MLQYFQRYEYQPCCCLSFSKTWSIKGCFLQTLWMEVVFLSNNGKKYNYTLKLSVQLERWITSNIPELEWRERETSAETREKMWLHFITNRFILCFLLLQELWLDSIVGQMGYFIFFLVTFKNCNPYYMVLYYIVLLHGYNLHNCFYG